MRADDGIVVEGLSKTYGAVQAVDDVGFTCPAGTVTAFLGPNGSGKSTTLRLMTGLARPDTGKCTFGGKTMLELDGAGRSVGVLLDAGAHHNGRSTVETVTLAALLVGQDVKRARDCLELVGLRGASRRRVGTLSLGMRQRLGLAIALIGNPRYLVLDEPANGLDPEGISWMAGLLRDFAARGGTVLLSSHHLADVQAIADHIVILDQGRVVRDFIVADEQQFEEAVFATADDELFLSRLANIGIRCRRGRNGDLVAAALPERIGAYSIEWAIPLVRLGVTSAEEGALHDLFLSSTTGEFVGGRLRLAPERITS